ncbi:uncharacterized protein LOC114728104 [Neltuma alba]|uniref:uncharacterized protein LOC114728104 n=1 Tax=Neltuma alba TaxID=207710 RepID=UPI0010A41B09|nr:uncharacterized protein LOC114728104 [Prosopis alba]
MAMDLTRITLRPFKLSDVDDFMLWAGDDEVTQNTRMSLIRSREEALTFIRDVCIPHPWRRSICIDDRCIGMVSVSPNSGAERCRAELGYALAAPFWGQGIATKAVNMAVSQAFSHFPDLLRLEALVDSHNKASQRVLEKAGFIREALLRNYAIVKGIVRDVVIHSFLSSNASTPPNPSVLVIYLVWFGETLHLASGPSPSHYHGKLCQPTSIHQH